MTRTQHIYFNWLCEIVGECKYSQHTSFSRLLKHLHDTEFEYSMPMDARRAREGVYLRHRFAYITGELEDDLIGACSVLEMMVALAIHCEESIMVDPDKGDRTSQWFWEMIKSLGLNGMTDIRYNEDKVNDVLAGFFNRDYAPNGKGGLFTIRHGQVDMRQLHIWDQLLAYLNTIA